MSEDRFLARWSRRKQEARQEPPPVAVSAEVPEPADPASPEPEPEATAEEIAALPPVESVADVAGLRQFLRRGIPAGTRNAALRRIWRLDPKIRDHVDAAQDYAFDWNAPGGVPGGGGTVTREQVAGILDRLFAPKVPAEPARQEVAQSPLAEPVEKAGAETHSPPEEPPFRESTAAPSEPGIPRGRHGSATPS